MDKNIKGFELYQGPSLINGKPIVMIMTLNSKNSKTGNMAQTWILGADRNPVAAVQTGWDKAICGDCPLRGTKGQGRACYVNVGHGPRAVYAAWKRGIYKAPARLYYAQAVHAGVVPYLAIKTALAGRHLRIGAYGDPAAVPVVVWQALIKWADAHTGYTHQWRNAPGLRGLVQASVESDADAAEASHAGWNYFRATNDTTLINRGEINCPAWLYQGKVTCLQCGKCDGKTTNVMIEAHGSGATHIKN